MVFLNCRQFIDNTRFSDPVAAAHQLPEGHLRPHVRVLAEGRQKPAELSGNSTVLAAEKPGLQARV